MKHVLFALVLPLALFAQNITLPAPDRAAGKPLYELLQNRSTERSFDKDRSLSEKQLSQILWAAAGTNRTKDKNRTAPTVWGNNEINLYVLLESGSYLYDPIGHELQFIAKGDNREAGGRQALVKDAPMTIVLIADLSKIGQIKDREAKVNTASVDAGYISQNIYLAAGSEGLVTGARGNVDHDQIKKVLGLGDNFQVIVANSVGYGK